MQPCPIYVRRGGYQPPVMPDAGPGMAGRRGRRPLRVRDRGFYRRGDSRIARWPVAHTGNGAAGTSVPTVGADVPGGPAVSANDSRTIWATSYDGTGSSFFREGQAPPLRGAGLPGRGANNGMSRTPSPAGWCNYRAWYVNRGRGKPLPCGGGRVCLGAGRTTGRRGRRPLRGGANIGRGT